MTLPPAILAAQAAARARLAQNTALIPPTQQTPIQEAVQEVAQEDDSLKIAAPNILIMGPAGTGKTYCLATAVEAGLEVFVLMLEQGIESLLGYWADRGLPVPKNLHWHVIKSTNAGFQEQREMASKVNSLTFDALTKVADPNKSKNDKFVQVLTVLSNFYDQRTKKHYGGVDSWDENCMIAIDGLTGLSDAAMTCTVGNKPVKGMNEWGVAQNVLLNLLKRLTEECQCWCVVLSHVERETDMVLGGVKLMPSTLGKALPPKLPAMFSDAILARREGDKWFWSTSSSQADCKTRNLPLSETISPDFRAILTKYRNRVKMAEMLKLEGTDE